MNKKVLSRRNKKVTNILSGSSKMTISALMLGIAIGYGIDEFNGIGLWYSKSIETDKINICFTPPAGCGLLIAGEIAKANKSIYVQSYDFTSDLIAKELIKAHKRGIKVSIIVDKIAKNNEHSMIPLLEQSGIEITVDRISGLAHNKVMVIDSYKVITGSFNFTKGADRRNAENVVLIEDELVAEQYLKNWMNRKFSY